MFRPDEQGPRMVIQNHEMNKEHYIRIGRFRVHHFRFLLIAMVSIFVLRPFMEEYARMGLLTDIFFCMVLLSGIFAFTDRRKARPVAVAIVIPALILQVASYFHPSDSIEIVKRIFFAVFLAYLLIVILSHIFRQKEVTEDLITGAVCAYFLIGLVWTFIFYFLELAREGSFSIAKTSPQDIGPFLYYSFVTLATLGYGDIVPLTSPARSLGVLEAVAGQLYLAITIARLVSAHASRRGSTEG
jgi:hypothetical protein